MRRFLEREVMPWFETRNPALLKQLIVNLLDKVDERDLDADEKRALREGLVEGFALSGYLCAYHQIG